MAFPRFIFLTQAQGGFMYISATSSSPSNTPPSNKFSAPPSNSAWRNLSIGAVALSALPLAQAQAYNATSALILGGTVGTALGLVGIGFAMGIACTLCVQSLRRPKRVTHHDIASPVPVPLTFTAPPQRVSRAHQSSESSSNPTPLKEQTFFKAPDQSNPLYESHNIYDVVP